MNNFRQEIIKHNLHQEKAFNNCKY